MLPKYIINDKWNDWWDVFVYPRGKDQSYSFFDLLTANEA